MAGTGSGSPVERLAAEERRQTRTSFCAALRGGRERRTRKSELAFAPADTGAPGGGDAAVSSPRRSVLTLQRPGAAGPASARVRLEGLDGNRVANSLVQLLFDATGEGGQASDTFRVIAKHESAVSYDAFVVYVAQIVDRLADDLWSRLDPTGTGEPVSLARWKKIVDTATGPQGSRKSMYGTSSREAKLADNLLSLLLAADGDAAAAFAAIDTDGDGSIVFDELLVHLEAVVSDLLIAIWGMLDRNGDGSVTHVEWLAAFHATTQTTSTSEPDPKHMFMRRSCHVNPQLVRGPNAAVPAAAADPELQQQLADAEARAVGAEERARKAESRVEELEQELAEAVTRADKAAERARVAELSASERAAAATRAADERVAAAERRASAAADTGVPPPPPALARADGAATTDEAMWRAQEAEARARVAEGEAAALRANAFAPVSGRPGALEQQLLALRAEVEQLRDEEASLLRSSNHRLRLLALAGRECLDERAAALECARASLQHRDPDLTLQQVHM